MSRRGVLARATAICFLLAAVAPGARATCPDGCFPGGGPAASDCLLQFSGISAARTTCTDGDPACDADAAPNGVCTFALTVCINQPTAACTPDAFAGPTVTPPSSATARALAAGIADLDPAQPGCAATTAPVMLRPSFTGGKSASARVTIAATGKRRDRDRLVFICKPATAAPSLARDIQPIFTRRCAISGCHITTPPNSYPLLETGSAYGALIDQPSRNVPSLSLVRAGDAPGSYLARKVLGKRIVDRTSQMPEGCPHEPPAGGCLTPAEQTALISWILAGAPDN